MLWILLAKQWRTSQWFLQITNTQMHKYSNAQIHKCTNTQMHQYTYAQIQKCTNTQMHKCTNTQMHKYTNTQIHEYTNKQILKWTNTQMHKYTNAQMHKYTNAQTHKCRELYRMGGAMLRLRPGEPWCDKCVTLYAGSALGKCDRSVGIAFRGVEPFVYLCISCLCICVFLFCVFVYYLRICVFDKWK